MNLTTPAVPGLRGDRVNVAAPDRLLSVFAGGAITAYAFRKHRPLVAAALGATGSMLVWRGLTGRSPASLATGANSADGKFSSSTEQTFTIEATAEELYSFWRDFENLPKIMHYLDSVVVHDEKRSLWRAKGPAGKTVEWEAEVTRDIPNERIEWRSLDSALVSNSGYVDFRPAPGGRGTEVRVHVDYQPPAGKLGETVAKILGRDPGTEIREDLRRFKQIMEAGEIPTTLGQPAAHRHSMLAPFSVSAK